MQPMWPNAAARYTIPMEKDNSEWASGRFSGSIKQQTSARRACGVKVRHPGDIRYSYDARSVADGFREAARLAKPPNNFSFDIRNSFDQPDGDDSFPLEFSE